MSESRLLEFEAEVARITQVGSHHHYYVAFEGEPPADWPADLPFEAYANDTQVRELSIGETVFGKIMFTWKNDGQEEQVDVLLEPAAP